MRSINISLILFALLLSVIFGCGDGDDDPSWTGTWSLQSVDGQNWKDVIAVFGGTAEDKWTFHDDGTWDLEITTTLFEITDTEKVAGTYTITDTTFSISSPDLDSSLSDVVSVEETDDINIPDDSVKSGSMEDNGTWVRDGNTLTLTFSNGQVFVFKKL